MTSLRIEIASQSVLLFPERAAFWPHSSTLLVADLHLGRQQAWRAGGVPISAAAQAASLDEPLQRLSSLLQATNAARLVVLGDLLHAPVGLTDAMINRVALWRAAHASVRFEVVPGNHDRNLDRVADAWNLVAREPRVTEPPFEFVHDPAHATGTPPGPSRSVALESVTRANAKQPGTPRPALQEREQPKIGTSLIACCGHIHPMVRLATARDCVRVPAFLVSPRMLLFPAFSGFFSGVTIDPTPDARVYPIAGNKVLDLQGR